jgi:ABC-type glycerol-3-phosphate transport system substrate-binding protein
VRRLRGALVALACLGALAACGGGDEVNASTDPVEVEVGTSFEWNSFVVEDGWEVNGVKRSAGAEEVTTPEVKGTITNKADETRTAIFEMVFSADGDALATVNCSAAKMKAGQSQQLLCPGLSATMPEDYDAVVVQEFSRDTTSG